MRCLIAKCCLIDFLDLTKQLNKSLSTTAEARKAVVCITIDFNSANVDSSEIDRVKAEFPQALS